MRKKLCIYCDNMIDEDCILCPICGVRQSMDMPVYGGVKKDEQGQVRDHRGGVLRSDLDSMAPKVYTDPTLDPEAGKTRGYSEPKEWYLRKEDEQPEKKGKKRKDPEKRRQRVLKILVACAGLALLTSIYFLILILTRNAFLKGDEKLRGAIPAYDYTLNGDYFGDTPIVEMNCLKREGLFHFEATYDVIVEDDRLKHSLKLDIKGRNTFPFGWEVTEVNWFGEDHGALQLKIDGVRPIVQQLVENAIPTHRTENFSIWVDDQNEAAFHGNCVIGNEPDSNYTIMGAYSFTGVLSPTPGFGGDLHEYELTFHKDEAKSLPLSYSGTSDLSVPYFKSDLPNGTLYIRNIVLKGEEISCDAEIRYKDGAPTVKEHVETPLKWDTEKDVYTGNPVVSDRLGGEIKTSDPTLQVEVIIGLWDLEVFCNDESMTEIRGDYDG